MDSGSGNGAHDSAHDGAHDAEDPSARDLPPDEEHDAIDEDGDIDWERRVAEVSDELEQEGAESGSPSRLDAWRRRSAAGAILTGIARGLGQVFEKEKEEPSIEQETSGDPPTDLPVEADVQQGRARHSVVSIRPWLLRRHGDDPGQVPPKGNTGPTGGADAGAHEDP